VSLPTIDDAAAATAPVGFTGRDAVFRRLVARGALLELITFGFYRFWLITDIRRYLWSHTEIAGDALEYTGRAKELLFGFLVAMAVLGPVFLVYFLIGLEIERFKEFASLPLYLFLFAFGQFAVYRSRRYRLTRTVWRGVRFWMTGSGWSYAGRSIAWGLLLLPTLGLAYPWRLAALERYKLRHTHYGNLPGRFEGTGWRLFKRVWWIWLLGLLPFLAIAAGQAAVVAGGGGTKQPPTAPLVVAAGVGMILLGFLLFIPLPFLHAVRRAREWAWWAGGLRFGGVEVACTLPSGSLIGVYWTLVGLATLVVLVWAAALGGLTAMLLALAGGGRDAVQALFRGQIAIWALPVYAATYLLMLVAMGALWRIYTLQRVWRRVAESCAVVNIGAAADVAAAGDLVSGFGEGLADGLDFGV
jgi:uncharacterized membrane protein YjgN (DUF898 family)